MDEVVIRADGVGLKFRLRLEKRPTLKTLLAKGRNPLQTQKEFWALRDVSFVVRKGETLGVIGPNGSGKSTLLRVIGGVYYPDEGRVETKGRVSTLLSLAAGVQSELSGIENIFLIGLMMGVPIARIKTKLDEIVEFADLGPFIKAPVKIYSSGMLARLGFAIVAYLECDILLVDEILGVGDKEFRKKSQAKIRELMGEDRTVVLVSHNLTAIEEFSSHCLWLDKGRVRAYGATSEVVAKYQGSPSQQK
ncbi:MAG: ABC transporter ATP-binding protein [Candidatus Bipolaricaulis anaerobius]|nr:ABC transporter ATP-binding protein [Candidatus Bipolaricaulis anaerobius]